MANWHVYVGSEIGLLKGVNIEKNAYSNLNFSQTLSQDDEITAMSWEDSSEKRIYIGQKNQQVKIYDCESKSFPFSKVLNMGEGPIKGVQCYNGKILTGVESGIVKLWDEDSEMKLEINIKEQLNKMVANPFKPDIIGTGGPEHDLKVWDLQNPEAPIFKGKNVRNDFLDLRVPVWINDLKFKPNDTVVTCGRFFQVRMYDPRAQRRPVICMEFGRYPLMSISLAHNENQVVVGTSRGQMGLLDLRRKLLVHCFKGFAGSIRCVQCHPSLPLVASCGLDRFLRIHDLNKHKLVKKVYLKTRLNYLLMHDSTPDVTKPEKLEAIKKNESLVPDEEEEEIWDSMKIIDEKKRKSAAESVAKEFKKQKKEKGKS